MKSSSQNLGMLTLDLSSNESSGPSPPTIALSLSARGARQEGCPEAIRDQYGDAYTLGFEQTARFLRSRGVSPSHAEELSQAAGVRGWGCWHQLRRESAVTTWINTIALNLFRNELRRERHMHPLVEIQSGFQVSIAAIDAGRVLSCCSAGERILLEHQLNGLTIAETAQLAGVTRTAIRLRLLRARRAVRARLEQRARRLRESPVRALMRTNRNVMA